MVKTIKVLNNDWNFSYIKNSICKDYSSKITTVKDLKNYVKKSYKANVPGSFILDLFNNGIIDDPLFGDNAYKTQQYEAMHVWYYTKFNYDFNQNDKLVFEGLDTICDVYLDGKLIVKSDNMFMPFNATCSSGGEHELLLHFLPTVLEARKHYIPAQSNALWYNYQAHYIRKPSYMFGWDIMPRIVSCGIWKDIKIVSTPQDSINDVYVYTLYTKPQEKIAKIRIFFDINVSDDLIQNYTLRFSGKCEDSEFCEEITPWGTQYGRMAFEIQNAKIWWPKGYGEPYMYTCKAELVLNGKVLDTYPINIGLRTCKLIKTDDIDNGKGEFHFCINGEKIFCKGVNWSPLSPYPSENERILDKGLSRLLSTGSNIVRMWGGGFYEDDKFFDFCDKNGIMVWQDFMMACCVYPQNNDFIDNFSKEVEYQLIRLRNHPSIVLWSGDNECDCTYNSWAGAIRNPNENIITREVLPKLIQRHDLTRPYLPSSPYISELCYTKKTSPPEEHLWGDRPGYETDYYSKSQCRFVSEIGHHGAVSTSSALKFIPKDHLYPIMNENGEVDKYWLAHSVETMVANESPYKYRMKMLVNKVKQYLGYLPSNYHDFAIASQIIQAEAVKRFIEIFRRDRDLKTGFIYWNLTDGYGLSCESLIDYYDVHKLAFYYLKKAYEPVYSFIYKENDKYSLICSNDTLGEYVLDYTVEDLNHNTITKGNILVPKNSSIKIATDLKLEEKDIYIIKWSYNGNEITSHYVDSIYRFVPDEYVSSLSKYGLIHFEGFEK